MKIQIRSQYSVSLVRINNCPLSALKMRRLTEIKKNFYTTLYSFPLLSQLLLARQPDGYPPRQRSVSGGSLIASEEF